MCSGVGGLYDRHTGPQQVYLRRILASRGTAATTATAPAPAKFATRILNLISYDDAATLLMRCFAQAQAEAEAGGRRNSRVLLGIDGSSISGPEMCRRILLTPGGRRLAASFGCDAESVASSSAIADAFAPAPAPAPAAGNGSSSGGGSGVRYDNTRTKRALGWWKLKYPSVVDCFASLERVSE